MDCAVTAMCCFHLHVLLVVVRALYASHSGYQGRTKRSRWVDGATVNRQQEQVRHHDTHCNREYTQRPATHNRNINSCEDRINWEVIWTCDIKWDQMIFHAICRNYSGSFYKQMCFSYLKALCPTFLRRRPALLWTLIRPKSSIRRRGLQASSFRRSSEGRWHQP